jgi:hypothetical protein
MSGIAIFEQQALLHSRVGCIGTGFCDDSVLHGPTTPYTMERMTLIVPRSKSISPHFKPNISLCRKAYTDQAIDQGHRAVQELLIERTPKICRDCQ